MKKAEKYDVLSKKILYSFTFETAIKRGLNT